MSVRIRSFAPSMALALALTACGRGDEAETNSALAPEALPSEAELARDAELANEAAADEAADMSNFGGSATEMDQRNEQ